MKLGSRRIGVLGHGAAVAAAAMMLLSACGSSSYDYVRNVPMRTAFKVPTSWKLFDKNTFLGIPSGPQPSAPDPIQWLIAFDGSPAPSINHILNSADLATNYPQGIAMIFALSSQNRDQVNFQTLRNFLFPVDGFQSDDIQFIGYSDNLVQDNAKVRGLHMDVEFRLSALSNAQAALSSGSASSQPPGPHPFPIGKGTSAFSTGFVRVDQVAYLNSSTNRIYLLAVICSATCFQRDGSLISSTVNSWTVLP